MIVVQWQFWKKGFPTSHSCGYSDYVPQCVWQFAFKRHRLSVTFLFCFLTLCGSFWLIGWTNFDNKNKSNYWRTKAPEIDVVLTPDAGYITKIIPKKPQQQNQISRDLVWIFALNNFILTSENQTRYANS